MTDTLSAMERELKFFPVQNDSPGKLTCEQIRQFNGLGYVCPLDVFTPEEADFNRRYFDELMATAKTAGHNSYSINGWHLHCRGIYALLRDERILDCVEDLIGPNLVSVMTHFFSKEAGDTKQVSWHQDAPYWSLTPSKVVTVWLAIDDVDEGNAPMMVVPESHLHGPLPHEESVEEEQNVLNQRVRDPLKWGEQPVSLIMKAGQISMHTDMLLHGSQPNRSDRRRCGLTLRYIPPDVRSLDMQRTKAYIYRGEDPGDYWSNAPVPQGNDVPNNAR